MLSHSIPSHVIQARHAFLLVLTTACSCANQAPCVHARFDNCLIVCHSSIPARFDNCLLVCHSIAMRSCSFWQLLARVPFKRHAFMLVLITYSSCCRPCRVAGHAVLTTALLVLQAMLRGRKSEADKIEVQGITDAKLQQAAEAMEGFSGVCVYIRVNMFVYLWRYVFVYVRV